MLFTQKKKMTQYEKMTETPLPKLIGSLAVPTIISMMITNLYNLADSYFVSQLGTSASGAKKYLRVKKAYIFTAVFSTCVIGIISVIAFAVSGSIIQIFRNDVEVIEIGTIALRAQLAGMVLCPVAVCSNMLFQSIGKNKIATFLSALRSGVCFIPLIIILVKLFGIKGLEFTQLTTDIIVFIITVPCTISFLKGLKFDSNNLED